MGAASSRRSKKSDASTCSSLTVLIRRLILCNGKPERATPRQKRPLVPRKSSGPKKKGEKGKAPVPSRRKELAEERVALTAAEIPSRSRCAIDSDNDSAVALEYNGPSVRATLASQRAAAALRSAGGAHATVVEERPFLDDAPSKSRAGAELARPREPNPILLSPAPFLPAAAAADDDAPSEYFYDSTEAARPALEPENGEDDDFITASLPSFASLGIYQQPMQPTAAAPCLPVASTKWELQQQVSAGLGKYHAAMAAAREQVSAASHDVGRVGAGGNQRKFRRCVYDTELE